MARTFRSAAYRLREDLFVALVECLECGSPAGTRCVNLRGQSTVTCCGIRAEMATPMARAILDMILLLRSCGWLDADRPDFPMATALGILPCSTTGGTL